MSSLYYTEVVYPSSLKQAFRVLKELKGSLDKYKLKDNPNQNWIDRQENNLAILMHFIETSKETFELFQMEYQQAKQEGFRNGLDKARKEFKHQEEYGNLRFDNPRDKEQIRAATILNAQQKWNY